MDLETHNRIEGLRFLGGCLDTQDLFTLELESLIAEATAAGDQELLETVQTVGKHQIAFLLTERFRMLAEDRQANQHQAVAAWTN